MDNKIKQKLKNAPIKEVVIGLAIEGLFDTPDSIEKFYEQSSLKNTFINKEELKSVKFEISEKPKILQDVSPGYVFTNVEKTETIVIELNTIRYSDKSKYLSYESFIAKFGNIVDNILAYSTAPLSLKEIGLRYINQFNLNANKIGTEFLINPTIQLSNSQEISEDLFAAMNNYLSMANIQSLQNANIFSTVKTVFKALNPMLLDITFDIDTHDTTSYTVNSKEELNEKVLKLKDFKNLIFFSNFKNPYEMKEFQ